MNYSYYNNAGDQRLQEIKNLNPDTSVLSQSDYAYNAVGEITQWTQQTDSNTPLQYAFGYDRASQLASAVQSNTSTSAIVKQYFYGYDAAGNRTGEQIDAGANQASFNNVNQLTGKGAGGAVRVQGTLSEPGTVTVNSSPAQMTSGTSFVANPVLSTGTNTVTVAATDGSSNTQTNQYQVVVSGTGTRTLTYDAAGNETDNGNGQTYEWDAENRLLAINYSSGGTTRSEFTYDGLGRRVQIVEKNGMTVLSTKRFIWSPGSAQPSEERDGSNYVTKRFYGQGEQIGGVSYFYTKDHLGSVHEMTDASGTLHARYDYDPYGRSTKVSGDKDSDFTYAGYYNHSTSGMYLTLFRAYDADIGRWISRDPIGERGGLNLYGYVGNNPIRWRDSSGLFFGADDAAEADAVGSFALGTAIGEAIAGAIESGVIGDVIDGAIAAAVGANVGSQLADKTKAKDVATTQDEEPCPKRPIIIGQNMKRVYEAALATGAEPWTPAAGPLLPWLDSAMAAGRPVLDIGYDSDGGGGQVYDQEATYLDNTPYPRIPVPWKGSNNGPPGGYHR